VLDGEIVAFDEHGQISFGALQARMHVADRERARRLSRTTPVAYFVFDVLYFDGHDTLDLPYEQRRELLDGLDLNGDHWQTPPFFPDGATALATSRELGLEGLVAKRLDCPYESGHRSRRWIKVKEVRSQSVVIGGWKPGQGRRGGGIGSLLMGVPGEDGLEYVGHVGTGFTQAMLDDIAARLRLLQRKSSPFATPVPAAQAREAHWVTPKLVGEVVFAEWTRDGRLRAPSWRGLRPDVDLDDIRREGNE
jgi:bifunctional non-homologous end joining protein LigD